MISLLTRYLWDAMMGKGQKEYTISMKRLSTTDRYSGSKKNREGGDSIWRVIVKREKYRREKYGTDECGVCNLKVCNHFLYVLPVE